MGLELLEFPLPHSSASSTVMPSAQSSEMHPPHTPQPGHHCCHHPPVRDVICSASGMIQRNPQFWNTWGIAAERRENWNAQALCRAKKAVEELKKDKSRGFLSNYPFQVCLGLVFFQRCENLSPDLSGEQSGGLHERERERVETLVWADGLIPPVQK